MIKSLRERLKKTNEKFIKSLQDNFTVETREEILEHLEEALISTDMGIDTAFHIIDELKNNLLGWKRNLVKDKIRETLLEILTPVEVPLDIDNNKPFITLVLGVNGVGKTTTIAKLASIYTEKNKKVILGAGDTFRAAATEQLDIWAKRLNIEIVKQGEGSDPASVAFDTVKASVARNCDLALIDTAGRLHTKDNLMEELKKINRVIGKDLEDAPHEKLLIVDATTGQNALEQAKIFNEAIGVTGLILTKMDGTAKGGVIVALAKELKIPIRFIGVGEKAEDLVPFNAKEFVDALI